MKNNRKMIFLSAQPDSLYLKWQLDLQLFNFSRLGIAKEDIHILVGYDPIKGLNLIYKDHLEEISQRASFFFYEDTRTQRAYAPSIRPHIIKKHLAAHQDLANQAIFYHDADILFTALPDFDQLLQDDKWYMSDTRSYIGANHIKSINPIILEEMCIAIDIPRAVVEQNDKCAGGAQYLMKQVNFEFWHKVEKDCEKLYRHLVDNEKRYAEIYQRENHVPSGFYEGVLAWCTDMWVILWNGLNLGYDINITPLLDFCWPKDGLERLTETKIFHNAGLDNEDRDGCFFKGDFLNSLPFDTNLDHIRRDRCTAFYVDEMIAYRNAQKYDFSDVTFLLPVRIDSVDRLNNVLTSSRYLDKHLRTNIMMIEADNSQKIDPSQLPGFVDYAFIKDDNAWFHRTRYNNMMVRKARTPIVILYDVDVIISRNQLLKAVEYLRKGKAKVALPFDGCFKMVSNKEKIKLFRKQLDVGIFEHGETFTVREKACGGAVVLDKETFIACGMENESFYKWGPEDIERIRRMEILGYKAAWVDDGYLYHIQHQVHQNSCYTSDDEYAKLMRIHLDIINMSKNELQKLISTWHKETEPAI